MCGVSGVELLVIIVAAIIILGPEKLPELMGMAGRVARDVRRMRGQLGEVTREIRSQVSVDDLKKDLGVDRVRERVKDAESEIDAIRARLKKPVQLPGTESQSTRKTGDANEEGQAGSGADEGGEAAARDPGTRRPPAAWERPRSPAAWERPQDAPDEPSIEGPTDKPARSTVARGARPPSPRQAERDVDADGGDAGTRPSGGDAAGAAPDRAEPERASPPADQTPKQYRVRPNAHGAPKLVAWPDEGDDTEGS